MIGLIGLVNRAKDKMNGNKKKALASIIAGMVILSSFVIIGLFMETKGANTTIGYSLPADDDTFVDIYNGYVNYTVNVTDTDNDLAQVELWSNCTSTGAWAKFYDSGALGGVAYHNHSGTNTNWSVSGKLIYWNISAQDGVGWTNTTYSFRNEWDWSKFPHICVGGGASHSYPHIYKDPDNDRYLLTYDDVDYKISTLGTDWMSKTGSDSGLDYRNYGGYDMAFYDGEFYTAYLSTAHTTNAHDSYRMKVGYYNWSGDTWAEYTPQYDSSYIIQEYSYLTQRCPGWTVKYYSGYWYMLAGHYPDDVKKYRVDSIDSSQATNWEYLGALDSDVCDGATGITYTYPTSAIYNNLMYWAYCDHEQDLLYWGTFDGNTWSSIGSFAESDSVALVHDKLNHMLLIIYTKTSDGKLYYRATDNNTAFSAEHEIVLPSGWLVYGVYAQYFNQRINLVFYGRGYGDTNTIYMLTSPEYLAIEDINLQTGRIEFPDATPNEQHINSSVFKIRNVQNDSMDWIQINWSSFGDIVTQNNIEVWGSLDNSSWHDIGTLDATGNLTINTTTWNAGMPLNASDMRYMKFEILDVGSVTETTHTADSTLRWRIHFG